MAILENINPNYVTSTERQYKQILFDQTAQVAMVLNDIVIVADFSDREAEAISVSAATFVKVDAAGSDSAISAGDDLNGYRIGYKAAGAVAVGDAIAGDLEYWSVT